MRRLSGKTLGSIAAVALLLLTLGSTLGLGFSSATNAVRPVSPTASSSSWAPHALAPVRALAHPHPAQGTVTVNASITSQLPRYDPLPFSFGWKAVVTGVAINGSSAGANQSLYAWIEVRDVNPVCIASGLVINCTTVTVWSLNSSIVSGQSTYTSMVTLQNLQTPIFRPSCPNVFRGNPCSYTGGNPFPDDQYQVYLWVHVVGAGSANTSAAETSVYIATQNPSEYGLPAVVAPLPGVNLTVGNISLAVEYGASFLSGAVITITPANNTKTILFTQSVFAVGIGNHTVAAATAWTVTTPGLYTIWINLSTTYGAGTVKGTNFTVLAAPSSGGTNTQIIYENTTQYANSTVTTTKTSSLFGGLSPGASAAVLLVVGLIIGMIVAMLLGRMMWGGSKPPAQQWTGTKSANECSICHQTFGSEEEMKEHQKTAHGMQV